MQCAWLNLSELDVQATWQTGTMTAAVQLHWGATTLIMEPPCRPARGVISPHMAYMPPPMWPPMGCTTLISLTGSTQTLPGTTTIAMGATKAIVR